MSNTRAILNWSLFCSFFISSLCSAQTAEGTVVSMVDGQAAPLPGASVIWSGTTTGTLTDVDGNFELSLSEDSKDLVISFLGFESDTIRYNGDFIESTLSLGVELKGVDVVAQEESSAHFLLDPLNVQRLDNQELRKAACCNLSESFETNASIDASFTDAITGTRQIRMLGLSGKYSQILKDNIPNVRGLSTIYGLGYIPGDWIDDIYISKGAGSVTSGFESITGEINVAIKDPDTEEKAHFNLYSNEGGRTEFNTNAKVKVSETWNTIILGHVELNNTEADRNGDGFIDNPLKRDYVLRNQWKFRAKEHWEGQYTVNYLEQNQRAGQMDFDPDANPGLWGVAMQGKRVEASAKTGYVFDDAWNSSIGSQFSYDYYLMDLDAGLQQYDGEQETFRGNILYNTKLGCAKKDLTVGATFIHEVYDTMLDTLDLSRTETTIGAYAEFTWNPNERLSAILGMRVDEHNLFGTMLSPRAHLRYSLTEDLSLKGAFGRGHRTANPIADNLGLLASNRNWNIESPVVQESGWNAGLNLTYKFRLDYRDASLAIDAYRTEFSSGSVVDFETPGEVTIYSLGGLSYANTAQVEFGWEAMRRFDIRIAYRYTLAETTYREGMRWQPFNPEHRGFVNAAFQTKENEKGAKWEVDGTLQMVGVQRIPSRTEETESTLAIIGDSYSPVFFQAHGQVTRVFKKGLEVYLGVENATNYRQANPIQSSEEPFASSFDASMIWAPVFGRMSYLGLRWTIF